MPICRCLKVFQNTRTLRRHFRQSNDPRCIATRDQHHRTLIEDDSDSESEIDHDADSEDDQMDDDPPQFHGDFYGDNYGPDDFPGFDEDEEPQADGQDLLEEGDPLGDGDASSQNEGSLPGDEDDLFDNEGDLFEDEDELK